MIAPAIDSRSVSLASLGRVLITGANGMLGRAFSRQIARYSPDSEVLSLSRRDWDVCDESRNEELAEWVSGGLIIHCASMADVEGCARDPRTARQVIVGGTENVCRLASISSARLLYPQSFLIYGGGENLITEATIPKPLSLHGALKWESEGIVDLTPGSLIVRMGGFFGGFEHDKDFVGRIIPHLFRLIQAGQTSFTVSDRVWQPSFTHDLALNSLLLADRNRQGIYLMASHGDASFWEVTVEIARILGWQDRININPASSHAVPRGELNRRPDRAVMLNRRLQEEDLDLQRPWREALHEYLENPFFDAYRV